MDKNQEVHKIDLHVGKRVRARRKNIGLSQTALAEAVGLTFQQIQKYERGSNRISCSKLWVIAKTLEVPIDYFFQGFDEDAQAEIFDESSQERSIHSFLKTSEGISLASTFSRITPSTWRRKVLDLVKTLADDPQ